MRVGEPLTLSVSLWDRADNKHILARLFTDHGVELPESPIRVPHLSGGTYYYYNINNLRFPSGVFEVRAVYHIYDDYDCTIFSPLHQSGEDRYQLDTPVTDQIIYDKLNSIIAIITARDFSDEVYGQLFEEEYLVGVVDNHIEYEELTGIVSDESGLTAYVLDDEDISYAVYDEEVTNALIEDI